MPPDGYLDFSVIFQLQFSWDYLKPIPHRPTDSNSTSQLSAVLVICALLLIFGGSWPNQSEIVGWIAIGVRQLAFVARDLVIWNFQK